MTVDRARRWQQPNSAAQLNDAMGQQATSGHDKMLASVARFRNIVIRSHRRLRRFSVRAHEAAPLSPFALVSARPHPRGVAQGPRDIVARRRGPLPWRAFDGTRQVACAWLRALHRSWIAPRPLLLKIIQHRGRAFLKKGGPDRVVWSAPAQKHGPAIVRSVGGDGAVPRTDYGGTRSDPKLPAANLADGHESFVPLRCKTLYLLKTEDRRIAFTNDGRSLALFGWHGHRSGYRRAQVHRAMICQGD